MRCRDTTYHHPKLSQHRIGQSAPKTYKHIRYDLARLVFGVRSGKVGVTNRAELFDVVVLIHYNISVLGLGISDGTISI